MKSTQLDLNGIFASVVEAAQQDAENAVKLAKAVDEARKAHKAAIDHNEEQSRLANIAVSRIQSELNRVMIDARKAEKEQYEKTMKDLGMNTELFPLETVETILDKKLLTPAVSSVGAVAGKIANISKGISSRFMSGFKASVS
jgi:hypothetical protein